jgi:serine/threonine-protein kinase
MTLDRGSRLGPYEITGAIGAGGMGEVFRARDTKLGRDVAIKVLPAALVQDAERVARFRREAHLLASLNHPNIAAIYGLEEAKGVVALALELVEGEDLAERLKRGPIPVDETIAIAKLIAEALEEAHEKGIVHRDLKPANVKVTPDGKVKVLDFGLAKAWTGDGPGATSGADLSQSPTLAHTGTAAGIILGTAAYMSPEQARGKAVDRRADIWAFGALLYEMLSGRRLFEGETVSDTLAAVLKTDPDWSALPAGTPEAGRKLLRRCLERDPKQRLRDIGEARIALGDAPSLSVAHAVPATPGAATWRSPAVWAALALVAAVSAVGSLWAWTHLRPSPPSPVTRLTIQLPAGQVLAGLSGPTLSRDGRLIAYVAREADGVSRLYVRALDRIEASVVPGSEDARQPFFSPDGSRVGFFAGGRLLTASLSGGTPTAITDAGFQTFGATWGEDDTIVFVPTLVSGLLRIPSSGGKPQKLTEPDEAGRGYAHVWPRFLPGGRSVLYTIWGGSSEDIGGGGLLALGTGTSATRLTQEPVTQGFAGSVSYARSGHLLVSGSGGVTAASFDPDHPQATRARTPVLDDVYSPVIDANSWFSVSDTGTLAYVPGDPNLGTLVWVDRQGVATEVSDKPASVADATLSPDGTLAVVEQGDGLWVVDLRRGTRRRVTQDGERANAYPVWSRDGSRIFFGSNRGSDWDLYAAPASGGPAKRLLTRKGLQLPVSEAKDGTLLFCERATGTGADLWTLSPDGTVAPFVVSRASNVAGQYAPDGRTIAYVSDETGRDEVYLRSVARPDVAVAVSTDGGRAPRWSPDGKQLFYRRGDSFLAASVSTAGSLAVGDARKLFDIRAASGRSTIHSGYDVSPDGRRLLVLRLDPRAIPTQIHVVLNWFEELAAKVPSR